MPLIKEQQIENAIVELQAANLDSDDNRRKLELTAEKDSEDKGYVQGIADAIKQLNLSNKLATQNNINFLFDNFSWGYRISWHIKSLIKAGSHLVTQENFEAILPSACESYSFSNVHNCFDRLTYLNLSTQENFDEMIRYSYSSDPICGVLENLSSVHLGTQENLNLIFANARYAKDICSAAHTLKESKLLTQKNFISTINSAKYGDPISFL